MKGKVIISPVKWCMLEQRYHFKKIDEQALIKLKHPYHET